MHTTLADFYKRNKKTFFPQLCTTTSWSVTCNPKQYEVWGFRWECKAEKDDSSTPFSFLSAELWYLLLFCFTELQTRSQGSCCVVSLCQSFRAPQGSLRYLQRFLLFTLRAHCLHSAWPSVAYVKKRLISDTTRVPLQPGSSSTEHDSLSLLVQPSSLGGSTHTHTHTHGSVEQPAGVWHDVSPPCLTQLPLPPSCCLQQWI